MARQCDLLGTKPQFGHNVSHSNRRTKRRFNPNLQQVTFYSDALKHDVGLRVAEDRGAPAADVVDVLVAVLAPEPRAGRARYEHGLAAHRAERAHRAVHAAHKNAARSLEKLV